LTVTKFITCVGDQFPQLEEACNRLLTLILPNEFDIVVTDTNPNPSQFEGSNVPVVVTLGAGNYVVTESLDQSVIDDMRTVEEEFDVEILVRTTFTGNCNQDPNNLRQALGTIAEGESQTCNIHNEFDINNP
jgi:cellulose biosynthesis protein BcsQ